MLRYVLPVLIPVLNINLCLVCFFFFSLMWCDTVPTGIANSNVRIVFPKDDEWKWDIGRILIYRLKPKNSEKHHLECHYKLHTG